MANANQDTNEAGYNFLDDATGEIPAVIHEVRELKKIVSDSTLPLEDRLDAFEDIIDSEVGDTPMFRARNVERAIGLRQLYLKFEGGNPTGTQKDRIAFAQAKDALRRGFEVMTVATCGNYGVAVALAASLAGLGCVIYIPRNYHSNRVSEMTHLGAQVLQFDGDYEKAVAVSRQAADKNEYYDANPGGDNTSIQLGAYGEIANEIYDELREAPLVVAAPVSNGTTLAGIFRGFLSLFRRGKTSRMPRIVGGSSFGKNPIVQAFMKNRKICEDLKPETIHETGINEPLINWHAIDGDRSLSAIRQTNGWAGNATDRAMRYFAKLIRDKEGLQVLPAATAGLIPLIDYHNKQALPKDRYVVVLTGRKS